MPARRPRLPLMKTAVLLGATLVIAALDAAAELPGALRECRKERDDVARLACYDREVEREAALDAKSFGLSGKQKGNLEPAAEVRTPGPAVVSGVVAGLKAQADGRTVITLDDGAIWIQGEAYEPIGLHAGDRVMVKPGLLGSFYMYPPSGPPTRVRRLR
jgi:hypothetical protein